MEVATKHFVPDQVQREGLARAVTQLLDQWDLPASDRLALLGFASASRATLTRYRNGQPLAANRDLLDRVGHLLGIHKSLRLLFPENPAIRHRWMGAGNRAFGGARPVDVVERFGLPGLLMVRAHLDRARGR